MTIIDYLKDSEIKKENLLNYKIEMEGRYSSLVLLQQSTAEENQQCRKELNNFGQFTNTLNSKNIHNDKILDNLTKNLKIKSDENTELKNENDELTQTSLLLAPAKITKFNY